MSRDVRAERSTRGRVARERFETRAGSAVVTEHSDALPVVGVTLSFRGGAMADPRGREGLTRMLGRALRMGRRGQRPHELEAAIDGLGAQLSISVGLHHVHVGGVVVAHNLEAYLALLSSILSDAALRAGDVRQVRKETLAELDQLCDDDRTLAMRNFRLYAFRGHPYGRSVIGSRASVGAIGRADVLSRRDTLVRAGNLVIGVWGAFDPSRLPAQLDAAFGDLPRGGRAPRDVAEPTLKSGRRLLVVDKPGRSQTQILIGTIGSHARDRQHVPLVVANTAFGGLFTSRLTREVRGKRGWSYGASSSNSYSRTRELWSMWTFPAAKDAVACMRLQLDLYERWVADGVSARELARTKSYLVKSHAFDVDTASKRLDRKLDGHLYDLPRGYHERFLDRVRAVKVEQIPRALQQRLSTRNMVLTLVGTADELMPQLRELPIDHIDVVPFDDV